ncbi:septum formation initiator family protein [Nemorincola caseinilytica]
MKKVTRVIMNKYFIVTICFVAWVMYFDQNDWMTLRDRQHELDDLRANIEYLRHEIAEMETETRTLTVDMQGRPNDPERLERYARESFRMKHEGEDVYVIEQ